MQMNPSVAFWQSSRTRALGWSLLSVACLAGAVVAGIQFEHSAPFAKALFLRVAVLGSVFLVILLMVRKVGSQTLERPTRQGFLSRLGSYEPERWQIGVAAALVAALGVANVLGLIHVAGRQVPVSQAVATGFSNFLLQVVPACVVWWSHPWARRIGIAAAGTTLLTLLLMLTFGAPLQRLLAAVMSFSSLAMLGLLLLPGAAALYVRRPVHSLCAESPGARPLRVPS